MATSLIAYAGAARHDAPPTTADCGCSRGAWLSSIGWAIMPTSAPEEVTHEAKRTAAHLGGDPPPINVGLPASNLKAI
jgi:hypothetical protein